MPCNCIGPTWTIQDNLIILKSLIESHMQSSLDHIRIHSQIQWVKMWISLGTIIQKGTRALIPCHFGRWHRVLAGSPPGNAYSSASGPHYSFGRSWGRLCFVTSLNWRVIEPAALGRVGTPSAVGILSNLGTSSLGIRELRIGYKLHSIRHIDWTNMYIVFTGYWTLD